MTTNNELKEQYIKENGFEKLHGFKFNRDFLPSEKCDEFIYFGETLKEALEKLIEEGDYWSNEEYETVVETLEEAFELVEDCADESFEEWKARQKGAMMLESPHNHKHENNRIGLPLFPILLFSLPITLTLLWVGFWISELL